MTVLIIGGAYQGNGAAETQQTCRELKICTKSCGKC